MRQPFRAGRARGFRYADVEDDLAERIEGWLTTRTVDDGEALKPGRVYRRGAHVVKFLPAERIPFRRPGAVRIAELGARFAPIKTPAPVVAVALPGVLFAGPSVLVSAFVEGRDLATVWGREPRAEIAFAHLLAGMHRRRLFHGDLHPHNLLWDGADWIVLDLGALRHPLRTLRPRALALEQWAELEFRLGSPPSLRDAFEAYRLALGASGADASAWKRIVARSAALRAARSPGHVRA